MGQVEDQSILAKAWVDFRRRWLGVVVGVLAGLVAAFSEGFLPTEPGLLDRGIVFVAGVLIVAFPIYLFGLFRAPYIQRRQAREAHAQHHQQRDIEIKVQGVFASDVSDLVKTSNTHLIRITDLRLTNRNESNLSVDASLVFKRGDGELVIDDNPIGQFRRRADDGFWHLLDNPIPIPPIDSIRGELGFLTDAILMPQSAEEVRDELPRARLRLVDHVTRQTVEVPARNGVYQWKEHVVGEDG